MALFYGDMVAVEVRVGRQSLDLVQESCILTSIAVESCRQTGAQSAQRKPKGKV